VFEKLVELLAQGWEIITPVFIVRAYEGGVVLRWGKYNRPAPPGPTFKWPFAEIVLTTNTCTTTQRLPPQTLTTKDGIQVVLEAIVRYAIRDPKSFLLDIWDSVDVLSDTTMGAIRLQVAAMTYDELVAQPPEPAVLESVRKAVNQFGFKIYAVTFTTLGRIRSLRLLQGATPTNLAN